jgi:SAM-dependent methyltransferase
VRASETSAGYWDTVLESGATDRPPLLWRDHSDAVNAALVLRWLDRRPRDLLLKTDLYDEAVAGGLYPALAGLADRIAGIDISPAIVRAAQERYPGLEASLADVRELPFGDGEVDTIVSNSTLDHFDSRADLERGLAELHRVLRPGGELVVTLDNGANPIVALRNVLPTGFQRVLGVPYFVGATCGPRRLRALLDEIGFEISETASVMHCPRILAVAAARSLERRGGPRASRRYLRALHAFERLGRLPTRYATGYFVAAHARKL